MVIRTATYVCHRKTESISAKISYSDNFVDVKSPKATYQVIFFFHSGPSQLMCLTLIVCFFEVGEGKGRTIEKCNISIWALPK